MSGLKRLAKRGVINEQLSEKLVGGLIQARKAMPRPIVIPDETLILYDVLEVLEAISGELVDLLERRDRQEGKDDNPPEIPDEGP